VFGWLGMVLYFTQRWILGPVIPTLMVEFGVDKTSLGVVGSASLWGFMLTPILAGMVSDRLGRKYITLAGIFGFSLLTFFSGTAISTGQLFAFRFVTGIAEACFFIPFMAYILEVFPERPGFYLTLMTSGASLGWFTGPALSGWLVTLSGNWRLPFFVTGLTGLIVAGFLLFFWPSKESLGRTGPFLDRSLLRSKHIILLAFLSLVAAFNISAEFGFTMWLPAFLELEVFLSPASAGLIAGLYGVGQCLGRPVLGWISDRLAYRPVGITGAAVLGVSLILVLGVDSTPLRGVFTFQAGFIGSAVMGTLWTFTGLFFSSSKGLALGVITTLGYVAAATAPILIGYLGDHHSLAVGLRSVCVPSAFMAGLCFLATFMVQPPRRRGG
jgi:MFS family permease